MTPEKLFLHRLALGLGMSVAQIEATIGSSELDDWFEYWMEEPWGSWRDNAHAGLIAAACLNPWIKAGHERPTFHDFILKSKQRKQQDDLQSSLDWLTSVAKRKS